MNSIRCFSLFAILAFALIAPGCTTVDRVSADEPMPREGSVVLVRGLMDIFSLGLNEIEDDLTVEGVHAQTISGPRWRNVSGKIKNEYAAGDLQGPLVIVGHSYGADDAVRLARSLTNENIQVTVLALIDPTTPPQVSSNVVRCFNLYKSNPATDWVPALRGIAIDADNETTEIVNYDIRDHNDDGRFDWNNHFNIEEDEDVQAVIVAEILKACPENMHYVKNQPVNSEDETAAVDPVPTGQVLNVETSYTDLQTQ